MQRCVHLLLHMIRAHTGPWCQVAVRTLCGLQENCQEQGGVEEEERIWREDNNI